VQKKKSGHAASISTGVLFSLAACVGVCFVGIKRRKKQHALLRDESLANFVDEDDMEAPLTSNREGNGGFVEGGSADFGMTQGNFIVCTPPQEASATRKKAGIAGGTGSGVAAAFAGSCYHFMRKLSPHTRPLSSRTLFSHALLPHLARLSQVLALTTRMTCLGSTVTR
jgi:hypothetical protein